MMMPWRRRERRRWWWRQLGSELRSTTTSSGLAAGRHSPFDAARFEAAGLAEWEGCHSFDLVLLPNANATGCWRSQRAGSQPIPPQKQGTKEKEKEKEKR